MQSRFRFASPSVAHVARQACFGLLLLILSSLACAAPVLTVSPAMAPPGAQVTLTLSGASFSTTPANNAVTINQLPTATPTVVSATQLVVTVPTPSPDMFSENGYASVTVGGTTYVSSTSFILQPQITGISPAGGPPGTTVTITGSGFTSQPNAVQAYFYNAMAGIVSASSTTIVTTVPSGATTGQLWVTVGAVAGYQIRAASSVNTNFVVAPSPIIGSFPSSATIASTVTITGSNFGPNVADNAISINGYSATVLEASPTQLKFLAPPVITTGPIKLTVYGALTTSSSSVIRLLAALQPACTSAAVVADAAASATTQRVYAYGVQNAASVTFKTYPTSQPGDVQTTNGVYGGNGSWYADVNLSALDAGNPRYGAFTTAVSGSNVSYSNVGCALAQWNWQFPPNAPVILAFTNPAYIDGALNITGLNFSTDPTKDVVTVGGVAVTTFVNPPTTSRLELRVPTNVATGALQVKVNGIPSTTTPTVTIQAPLQPTCSGGATPQTFTAAATATTQRISVSGVQNATGVTLKSWWLPGQKTGLQTLAAQNDGNGNWHADVPLVPLLNGVPQYGPYETDVTLSNSKYNGVLCAKPGWRWAFPAAPTVTGLAQASGPFFSNVTITGSNFSYALDDDKVAFNGTAAAVLSADATHLTVAVPPESTSGPVSVSVVGRAAANAPVFTITPFAFDGSTWVNACAVNDPQILRVLRSEGFLVPLSAFAHNADGSLQRAPDNSYTLNTSAYTFAENNPAEPLVPSSLFFGEPRVAGGRSGFLVGPALFMTTPHGDKTVFNPKDFAVVFDDSAALSYVSYQTYTCGIPLVGPTSIPAFDVYFPDLTQPVYNTYDGSVAGLNDYTAFSLQASPGRPWVRLRSSGNPNYGDPALVVGHPEGLGTKVSQKAQLLGVGTPGSGPLLNGAHTFAESDGSMVYNLAHDYVEAAVSTTLVSCAEYLSIPHYYALLSCPSQPFPVNSPAVGSVQAALPSFALVTAPQGDVTDNIALSGSASTTYTLTAPATASSPINWSIVPPYVPAGAPAMTLSPAATSGTLAPGASYSFTATVGPASQVGTFDETLRVYDASNFFVDSLTHHINVASFAVSTGDFIANSLMQPPPYATNRDSKHPEYTPYHDYQVSNTGAAALTMTVASDSAWLSVTGPAQPSAGVTVTVNSSTSLTLAMDPGSSTTIRAGLIDTPDLDSTPLGAQRDGNVTFTDTSTYADPTHKSETRAAHFTPGLKFGDKGPLTESLDLTNGPDSFGAPLKNSGKPPYAVSSDFSVAKVAVTLELTVSNSFQDWGSTTPVQAADFPYFDIRLLRTSLGGGSPLDVWTGGGQPPDSNLFSNNVFHTTASVAAGTPADGSTWEFQISTASNPGTPSDPYLFFKSWSLIFQGQ